MGNIVKVSGIVLGLTVFSPAIISLILACLFVLLVVGFPIFLATLGDNMVKARKVGKPLRLAWRKTIEYDTNSGAL